RVAVRLAGTAAPIDRGLALSALGEGLTLMAEFDDADAAYAEAVELLESQGRWRHAATAAHARGRMLRLAGREDAASDATRTFREGLFTAVLAVDGRPQLTRAWQSIDGTVTIRAESAATVERLRWILALDDDHSDFLRSVRDDPMLGRTSRALRGLRPLRVATVAQALLRAFCGQLIEAKRARRLEQSIIRSVCDAGPEHLHVAPTTSDLAALAPSQL